jgi:hypothetical protein
MPRLFGREYSRQELLERVGHISQIGGTRLYQLADGNQKGVCAIDFDTGTGFRFTVLPDRGMDISAASYQGRSLCWLSPTGEVAPAFFEPEGLGFLRSFFGGLVTTCGLSYMGAPCTDGTEELGLHGRIGNTPARNLCHGGDWEGDEYALFAQGNVTEVAFYGAHLTLTRRISALLGENCLRIHDVVENHAFEPSPLMLLYHINIGFPVVDETAQIIAPTRDVKPRDAEAEKAEADYARFLPPTPGYREKCYYHDMQPDSEGLVRVAIANREFNEGRGMGVYIKYPKSELPRFTQWKMLGQGAYVTGLEPGNGYPDGRAKARADGSLRFIDPGEKVEFHVEIGVLTSVEQIDEFKQSVEKTL